MSFPVHTSSLTAMPAFRALQSQFSEIAKRPMRELFAQDPARFTKLSARAAGLFLDYSKNRLTEQPMQLLISVARERGVEARRAAMFAGEKINATVGRDVLHTSLRAPRVCSVRSD